MIIRSADGTALACDVEGHGPPLLLVHGTGATRALWRPVRPALAAHFTLHVLDRRGHGDSGDAAEYALQREYADIAAAVAAIGGPVAVAAHSFGALCALGAAQAGTPIARLVLYEPPVPAPGAPYHPPELVPAMRAAVAAGDPAAAMRAFLLGVHGMRPDDAVRLTRLAAARGQPDTTPLLLREIEAVECYRFTPPPAWPIPTLLLLGGDSPAKYHATAALLHAGLPDSRVEILAGQAHDAIRTAPAMVADAVLAFLGAV